MTWTARALRLCREYDMLPQGGTVLCAVSGGADSMCLLHWLYRLRATHPFTLLCAHYNHNLRGEESLRDEGFVRDWCRSMGVPLTVGAGDVAGQAKRLGRGVEQTARDMRYAFLEQTARAQGAHVIATAHTADDNAETVLLHLARGSALRGLAGIPPRRGNIVRPLLATTRREVEEYLRAHAIPHVEDSTNSDDVYSRNRVRHRVIPELKAVSPRLAERLGQTVRLLRADEEYLTAQAQALLGQVEKTPDGLRLQAALLAGLPDPIALRLARLALEEMGRRSHTAAHLEAVVALCREGGPSSRLSLPGLTARREYEWLLLSPAGEGPAPPDPVPLREGGRTAYGATGWQVSCRRTVCPEKIFKNPDTFFLSCDKITGTPVLRPRRTGDAIKLPGRETKTLKKLLIDEKVPLERRALLPVLADGAGVLAAAGFGPHAPCLAKPGEQALEIIFEKE